MIEKDFLIALTEAIERAGTQTKLAASAGVSQGTVSDYINGRCSIGNMTISTLIRFFPNIHIDFFGCVTGKNADDELLKQLHEIFFALDFADKVKLVALAAAKFGEKLREEAENV